MHIPYLTEGSAHLKEGVQSSLQHDRDEEQHHRLLSLNNLLLFKLAPDRSAMEQHLRNPATDSITVGRYRVSLSLHTVRSYDCGRKIDQNALLYYFITYALYHRAYNLAYLLLT